MADRYKIYEQLGSGGMGAVFRAYDNDLRRWVAIKRLTSAKDKVADDALMGDLRREADALASLRNPNIVTIFDVATDTDGLFMVMELLEGEDLADVVGRGPLHYDDFKELASQTLEALLAAHQRHILHRDIKPENIKVERLPGGRLQSKLIDFGLARAGLRARKQTEDQSGTVMGSIFYMAPEQLTRQPVDERSDLYSLGCVFYEALSGRKAFDGPDVAAIIDKHINHDLVPLHVIAPHVPPWLGAWVLRLMARKPDDRPSNAQQAIHELRAWEKMAATPAMMPWMPGAYAPMPYPPQGYPMAATTSSVPVPAYYSPPTGQVLAQPYPTGQVPASPPAVVTGHVAALPTANVAAQPVAKVSAPVKPSPSGTSALPRAKPPGPPGATQVRPSVPKARALRAAPATFAKPNLLSQIPEHLRKYVLGGVGALMAILLLLFFMRGGDVPPSDQKSSASSQSGGSASTASAEKIHFQLPQDRQFPPQDEDLVLHLVANVTAVKSAKDAKGDPVFANEGEAAEAWQDLAGKAGANVMVSSVADVSHSPQHAIWLHHHVKFKRSAIDFRQRDSVYPSFELSDPGSQSTQFPFGSAATRGPSGMTLCVVFQPAEKSLPTRVLSLSSSDGATVTVDVDDGKRVVARFTHGPASVSISSKDVDPQKPVCVFVTWDRETGVPGLRVRDAAGKTFVATGTAISPPEKPLTRFALAKSKRQDGSQPSANERFTGRISEVLLYASVLRPDQMQLLEGPNLRDYYFNGVYPLDSRLRTKLSKVEARGDWKLKASHNSGDVAWVTDGNVNTRWSTKVHQAPDQWFEVELPNEEEIVGFALDCQTSSLDYPRKFGLETSLNGKYWSSIGEFKGSGALIERTLTTPVRTKHLRFVIQEEYTSNHWMISELILFKK